MTPARALRRFGPVVLIACLLVAVVATGDWRRLSLTQLASHRQALTLMVAHRPMMSLLIFVGIFTAVVVACTPGPGVMAVAGGFLFGPWLGGAASLVSFTLGASLVFLACRTAFGDWAINRAGPLARRIEAGFSANAFSYLLTLRLIPIVPFFVTNIAAGLARVRLRDLVLATWIGSAPVSFVLGDLGAGLGGLFDRGVDRWRTSFAAADSAPAQRAGAAFCWPDRVARSSIATPRMSAGASGFIARPGLVQ